jgi:LytTr DNA-binding domain
MSLPQPFVSAIALTFGLSLLFATVGTSNTAGLPVWQAWLHWLLHIGTGLSLALAVANLCARSPRLCMLPLAVFLLLTGLIGALSFAPVALWFDAWLPHANSVDDDALDRWAAGGALRPYAAEFIELAPSYLLSWILLNAGPLIDARRLVPGGTRDAQLGAAGPSVPASVPADHGVAGALLRSNNVDHLPAPSVVDGGQNPGADPAPNADTKMAERNRIETRGVLDRLPRAIGSDLVSVSAELHYLDVVTTKGRATLLGRLSQLEAETGAIGLRVHRSHWVSLAHVRRVFRTRQGWQCEMRDGRRLPIARRRVSEVQGLLGRDFVVDATAP